MIRLLLLDRMPTEEGWRDSGDLARTVGASMTIVALDAMANDAMANDAGSSGPTGKIPAAARPILSVDLSRLPVDHPVVTRHPDAFAIRRSAARGAAVDPRRPMPATGEAIARFTAPEGEALHDAVIERLAPWVAGAAGLWLRDAARLPAALIRAVRAAHPDLMLIAGPDPDRAALRGLVEAGVDRLVSSFAWWDLDAPWFVEELAGYDGIPLLAGIGIEDARDPVRLAQRLSAAEALGLSPMLPADAAAAVGVLGAAPAGTPARGELRRLSDAGADVSAFARACDGGLLDAGEADIILVNRTERPRPAPSPAALRAVLGAAFDWQAPADALAPGEVRRVTARRSRPILSPSAAADPRDAATDWPRLVIDEIDPAVDGGTLPVKRVVGETVTVAANIFADGHEQLAGELLWRAADEEDWRPVPMRQGLNDRWTADFAPERLGAHEFAVEGWLDLWGGWRRDFGKKLDAGVALPVDFQEGRLLVREAAARSGADLSGWADRLEAQEDGDAAAALLLSDELRGLMWDADERPHRLRSAVHRLDAERLAARFSSWYELFPRSITDDADRHGTFDDVIGRLPAIRAMGFDTLYFPPIHPIGRTNRKGPNNSLTAGPDDPGSPYAIGGADGGHDAVHPELGGFAAFDRLVAAARDHGLEIALDFAIQCSPDHPWLRDHPGWFAWRPDGSMKYAENPPKKYQDIVNVDFYGPDAVPALWTALRDVVLLWIDHGVKVFRVDNPHTKPLPFWQWMIADVRARHPDVIFLAEAFTRPTMMYRLGKIGFSQSYTYFTWRDRKAELTEYITELTTTAPKDFYRPHFFVNTPDINPTYLQTSGRPGFRIRAALAATLSGLFGVYSGFELCEAAPIPGKEEYLDSEKYVVKPRDWQAPGNIIADITLLNRLRRAHPALQTHLGTRFFEARHDSIIWYGRPEPGGGGMVMVMVNLDPHHAHACDYEVPLWTFGLPDDGSVAVEDLVEGHRFRWHGKYQHVRIDPDQPYRIWRIAPGEFA